MIYSRGVGRRPPGASCFKTVPCRDTSSLWHRESPGCSRHPGPGWEGYGQGARGAEGAGRRPALRGFLWRLLVTSQCAPCPLWAVLSRGRDTTPGRTQGAAAPRDNGAGRGQEDAPSVTPETRSEAGHTSVREDGGGTEHIRGDGAAAPGLRGCPPALRILTPTHSCDQAPGVLRLEGSPVSVLRDRAGPGSRGVPWLPPRERRLQAPPEPLQVPSAFRGVWRRRWAWGSGACVGPWPEPPAGTPHTAPRARSLKMNPFELFYKTSSALLVLEHRPRRRHHLPAMPSRFRDVGGGEAGRGSRVGGDLGCTLPASSWAAALRRLISS